MIELAVVRFAAGWRILAGDLWRGRFDYKVDAVDAALRLAADIDRRGQPVTLLVQDTFGEIRPFALVDGAARPRTGSKEAAPATVALATGP